MSRRAYGQPCEHGGKPRTCKLCKKSYDVIYNARKQAEYKEFITERGCAACGFNHPNALDVHHFASEYKRYGRSQSGQHNIEDVIADKAVVLCANCHSIFHGK